MVLDIRQTAQLFSDNVVDIGVKKGGFERAIRDMSLSEAQLREKLYQYISKINTVLVSNRPFYQGGHLHLDFISAIFVLNDILSQGGVQEKLILPENVLFTVMKAGQQAEKILGLPKTTEEFLAQANAFKESVRYKEPFEYGLRVDGKTLIDNSKGTNTGTATVYMRYFSVVPRGDYLKTLSLNDVTDILEYFAPFENDGKVHANIEALKKARDILQKNNGEKIQLYMNF